MPSLERAAALGLALVLAVAFAAAGLRLGVDAGWLRPLHRAAASLEVLVVLWLLWKAWRLRAVQVVAALSAGLSIIGIAAGRNPPPAASAANLLGGLALAAAFAWLLGRERRKADAGWPWPAAALAVLIAVQISLGAWLSIVERAGRALPAHGVLAMILAGLLGWTGLARVRNGAGRLLFALALAALLAGFTSLQYDSSAGAAIAHACVAALLIATAAYAWGREA